MNDDDTRTTPHQGAVPGITVNTYGTSIVGREAVDYAALCAMVSALRFEVETGMRMTRTSVLSVAKQRFGMTGNKKSVLAQLERLRAQTCEEMNTRAERSPS